MGRLDLYSTINAGQPGRYSASDAGNGSAPGSVADKVRDQMGGHEKKALAFLGGDFKPTKPGASAPAPAGRSPFGPTGPVASSSAAPTVPDVASAKGAEKADDGTQVAELLKALMAGGETTQPQPAPALPAPGRLAPEPLPRPSPFDASRFFA